MACTQATAELGITIGTAGFGRALVAGAAAARVAATKTDDAASAFAYACSFSGDTPVLMADGTEKPIETVQAGDEVASTEPETGENSSRIVTGLWHHADTLTDLVLANGLAVSTTEDHPFWNATDQQWQPAEQLESGEQLLTANGTTATVERLDWATARDDTAYNLTVADTHTYYVLAGNTPVLVHNTNGCGVHDWTSTQNLDDHFARHGEEMGLATQAEYRYAAQDLMCTCGGRRDGVLIEQDGNTRYFLDPKTGEFGIASERGIVTYDIPENPSAHFNNQPPSVDTHP